MKDKTVEAILASIDEKLGDGAADEIVRTHAGEIRTGSRFVGDGADDDLVKHVAAGGSIKTATPVVGPDGHARAKAGGFGRNGRPGEWLAAALKAHPLHPQHTKTLSSGSGLGDSITPPDFADWFWDRLAPLSVGLVSGFRIVETGRGEFKLPRVTGDQTASWTAENATITASDPSGDLLTATPRKLAALTVISNEVWRDSEPTALAVSEDTILRALALKLDQGFFEGSGTAPEIRGLKNVSSIQTVDVGTNGAAPANLDWFADAIGLLAQENAAADAIVMNPRTWRSLSKLKEQTSGNNKPLLQESAGSGSQGIERSIYGVRVFLTSQLSITETQGTATNASSVYVYQASEVVAVRRQQAQLDVDPYYGFDTDQVGVRAISRWDVVVPNPKSVVRILGVIP